MRRRNSMRYAGYDYTQPGAYFVTICAYRGRSIFGTVVDQAMRLNPLGMIAQDAWPDLAKQHAHIRVDCSVVMPNHAHALLWIVETAVRDGVSVAGQPRRYGQPIAGSVSTLVNAYKMTVTKRAISAGLIPGPPLWQRNFWDRIVRDERELANIRQYIAANPARWIEDQLHPDAPPNQFNQW